MKKFQFLFALVFAFSIVNAQCEFPRNLGTQQYQNAIKYKGSIYQTNMPDGRMVFSVNPSGLSLNKHEITSDSILKSSTGEWFFKWHYAAKPNRWQPMMFDCDASSVSLVRLDGKPLTDGQIEVDFFYYDEVHKISATYKGTFVYDIRRDVFKGGKNVSYAEVE